MSSSIITRKSRGPITLAAISLITAAGLLLTTGLATAAGPHCTAPYVQVQDAGNTPTGDTTGVLTIESISFGEPLISCTQRQLRVVIKVGTLDPAGSGMVAPPPNTSWQAEWVIPGSANSSGVPQTIFVVFDTNQIPTGRFDFGFVDASPTGGGLYTSQCALTGACQATGTTDPDGTITITFNMTTPITFTDINSVVKFTMPAYPEGTQLTSIAGNTFTCACAAGNGLLFAQSATVGDGSYTIMGNLSCSTPPTAALASNVTSGNAPLTVNFDASASSNTGGCGTLDSYIFDFGDGTQVTQATPTVSHTYTLAGTYPARVRVTNTAGVTSANIAQVDITVNPGGGPPLLGSIVSRMTHGAAGDKDILLPQSGTQNTECRSGGAGNNYKLVYTFINNLVSVASASVTAHNPVSGTGSVSSSSLGPNANQYTVNLTGVSNVQNLTVTLNTAVDSIGASGNVSATVGVLIGDTSNNKVVSNTDVSAVKGQVSAAVTASNFRTDVTANGNVSNTDVSAAKATVSTTLP